MDTERAVGGAVAYSRARFTLLDTSYGIPGHPADEARRCTSGFRRTDLPVRQIEHHQQLVGIGLDRGDGGGVARTENRAHRLPALADPGRSLRPGTGTSY